MNARAVLLALLLTAGAMPARANALDAVLAERIAQSETPACLAVALVSDKKEIAVGCSPEAGPVRMNADSLFEIGSITKGLTGILLADMVLRGEVKLEDPAATYSRPGAKLPTRDGREITLRDLVTHTASLPRMPPGFRPGNNSDPYADFDVDALYAALAKTELSRDIGTSSEYSNFGFMWLSEILTRRAGKASFEELLVERLLEPLGMNSTRVDLPQELRGRFIHGHNALYQPVPPWHDAKELAGVGGVRSSLADMTRLAEALAGRVSTPLDKAIELALTPLHRLGDPDHHLGYAWFIRDRPTGRVFSHGGGTGGFAASLSFSRELRTAAIVLVDSTARFDDLALHLLDPNIPLLKKRVALPLDAETRRQYAGSYELRPGFVITVWEDGDKLMSRATGQMPVEYFRQGTDSFFMRVVNAFVVFTRDKEGRVDGLVLHQGGRQVPGKRVTP